MVTGKGETEDKICFLNHVVFILLYKEVFKKLSLYYQG